MKSIKITQKYLNEIIRDAQKAAPAEICGLLIGKKNHIQNYIQMPNISNENSKYIFNPDIYIKTLYDLELNKIDILGIYHSHPFGPNYPSETDLKENHMKNNFHLIISNTNGEWTVRAFLYTENNYTELELLSN